MLFSVSLHLMLLPPYPAQHQVSIPCQVVLEGILEDMMESSFYHSNFSFSYLY